MNDEFLNEAEDWLRTHVAPRANGLDQQASVLASAFDELGGRGWLALRAPRSLGGLELGPRTYAFWQALVARFSGALAFLQTQHQSAASMILAGSTAEDPESCSELARRVVPKMAVGELKVGIGYGHLRRPGPPAITARAVDDGVILDGRAPWVTGAQIFDRVLVGAVFDDQHAASEQHFVFALVPLRNLDDQRGGIQLSNPMAMASMSHTHTVAMTLDRFHVPAEDIARIEPSGWMAQRDATIVARKSFFALGCARAGIDIVQTMGRRRDDPEITAAGEALDEELTHLTAALLKLVGTEREGNNEARQGRAHAVELAGRAAHAAVTATAGSANLADNPAQRVFREALLFTVLAQTPALRRATLSRLATGGRIS